MSETGKAFTRGGQITFHNLRMWLQINISENIRHIRDDLANSFVKERVSQIESSINNSGEQEIQSHLGQSSGLNAPQDNTFSSLSIKGSSSNNNLDNEVKSKMHSQREEIRNKNDQVSSKTSLTNNDLHEKAQPVNNQSKSNNLFKWTKKEF